MFPQGFVPENLKKPLFLVTVTIAVLTVYKLYVDIKLNKAMLEKHLAEKPVVNDTSK